MTDHEGHLLRGHCICCNDEVALVFTVRGIENYDELPIAYTANQPSARVFRIATFSSETAEMKKIVSTY